MHDEKQDMITGLIYDIKEFSVFDGPGIRKTVFFKGCPLRCVWCHNPEGISFEKQIMVSKGMCTECGRCGEACHKDKCDACGACVNRCPLHLRKVCGVEYTVKDLAAELLKGKEILEKNNGGITISGGEPLAQPAFLLALIDALKPVHVALDTSGYAVETVFREAVGRADLVLMDIKHTDPIVHKRVTGVDNALILKNLGYLCRAGKPFYVRIPLIPGVNDGRENMERTAALLKDANGLVRVEFLPYNKAAGAKYAMIGEEYHPGFDVNKAPVIIAEPFDKYRIRSIAL